VGHIQTGAEEIQLVNRMFAWVGISEAPISELSGDDTGLIAIAWLSGPILAEEPYRPQKA